MQIIIYSYEMRGWTFLIRITEAKLIRSHYTESAIRRMIVVMWYNTYTSWRIFGMKGLILIGGTRRTLVYSVIFLWVRNTDVNNFSELNLDRKDKVTTTYNIPEKRLY